MIIKITYSTDIVSFCVFGYVSSKVTISQKSCFNSAFL